MNVAVMVPARGGSKGIPGKNIKLLAGKPLIAYTLEAALHCFSKEQIVISTDDVEIQEKVQRLGFETPYLRPAILAQDDTPTEAVIRYELDQWKDNKGDFPEVVVLLQVTSPFRSGIHIKEAWELFLKADLEMLVSVCESKQNPYYNLMEEHDGYLQLSKKGNFTRRQDCPPVWELNGAIYIFRTQAFLEKGFKDLQKAKYVMKPEDSIDIDTPMDWDMAEYYLKK